MVLALVVISLPACGGSGSTGVLTGEIRFVGGITPRGGIGPKPGRVIVFTTSGHLVASQRVDRGNHLHYRFVLPPGRYGVNAGSRVRYDYPLNCRPRLASVRSGRISTINVYDGCGIE
jgi:hypothetical protein